MRSSRGIPEFSLVRGNAHDAGWMGAKEFYEQLTPRLIT